MSEISPKNPPIGNVTSAPFHVTDFQASLKGFGKKYYPLMNLRRGGKKQKFQEAVSSFKRKKLLKPKPDPDPFLTNTWTGDPTSASLNRVGTFGDGAYPEA